MRYRLSAPAARLWASLHEPRTVTAMVILVYGTTFCLGVSILQDAALPRSMDAQVIKLVGGAFLVAAGATGAPGAWRGAYWLEATAAIAQAGGYLLWGIYLVSAHFSPDRPDFVLAAPWTTLAAVVTVVLFSLMRFEIARMAPYAPGRGPLLPEVEARLEAAAEKIPDDGDL